jgi:hypothetical protein
MVAIPVQIVKSDNRNRHHGIPTSFPRLIYLPSLSLSLLDVHRMVFDAMKRHLLAVSNMNSIMAKVLYKTMFD